MAAGVQDPSVIDFVGYDSETDNLSVVMIEERSWTASEERFLELQNKLNNYLSFILDGQLHKLYPEYKDKAIVIELNCSHQPDAESSSFLDRIAGGLADFGISWRLKVRQADSNKE